MKENCTCLRNGGQHASIVILPPNVNPDELVGLVRFMLVKTGGIYLTISVSALVRSMGALHNLCNNKIRYEDMGGLEKATTKHPR